MRSKKVNKNLIMMIIVLFITLGYAYLNSELKINGTTGISGNTWDVHFENVIPSSDNTVTPTIAPVANPQDKVTELTYSVLFNKPGDVFEFNVDIVNEGSIDAMVELITSTIKIGNGEVQELNNTTLPSYINYYVKYSDGVNISSNHLLNKETSETIKIHVEYKADITNEELVESAGKTIEFTYGLKYVQAASSAKARPLANNCIYNGELIQGATYVNGQYTYRYMQEGSSSGWSNITNDGWGVKLTDSNSTDPVTTPLCTSINGKPIVSMSYAFNNSKATSIDLSSFDTSNVTNMMYMFTKMSSVTSLDVGYFDTSNVTNMDSMFNNNSVLENIDNLDNFDTKNVVNMYYMFASSKKIKNIKITKWDVSKVTDVNYMFYELGYNSSSLNFEVANFNLSRITSISNMFSYVGNSAGDMDVIIKNINMDNVTNVAHPFYYFGNSASGTENLNISNFSMNSLVDAENVFAYILQNANIVNVTMNNISFNSTTNINSLFRYIGASAKELDFFVSNLHARSATSADSCISGISNSRKTIIHLKDWETPELTSAFYMFNHIDQGSPNALLELTIDNIDFTKVTTTKMMFYSFAEGNSGDTKIVFKNISTPNLTSTEDMFRYAGTTPSKFEIEGLNNFDFSHVTNCYGMFSSSTKDSANVTDLGTLDLYADNIAQMFNFSYGFKAIINLHKKPTNYSGIFGSSTYNNGASIIVNYTSEVDNIDDIIATANGNPNIIKGNLIN